MPSMPKNHGDDSEDGTPTSRLGLPALDISFACPRLTPASTFPDAAWDYYQLDDLLTAEEKDLRCRVRGVMEKEVAPIAAQLKMTNPWIKNPCSRSEGCRGLNNQVPPIRLPRFTFNQEMTGMATLRRQRTFWETAECPLHVIPKLASLGFGGGIIKGYGCSGLSAIAHATCIAEVARVDASLASAILVHSSLAMLCIECGSEAQKHKYLPSLSHLRTVSSYALSEPDHGSDASSLRTTASKVPGGWVIDGQKRWIANSTFADILVVLARNATTNQVNGFIVKKGSPGLKISKIENKVSLRIVQNCDILLDKVFVPDDDVLPGASSFQDLVKALSFARVMVAWLSIGISMGVYDVCLRYVGERKQFGAPLAAFQMNQEKLVRMLGNIQAMFLLGWRLCKLHDAGKMTSGQASLGKAWITLRARETVSLGRELLAGNGILTDFLVGKAFCDMESVYSYEGSYEVNVLVAAREVTGIASFKPRVSSSAKTSRL